MKIERISYSESRESASPIGLKSWKKYNVDVLLEEGDDQEHVRNTAKNMVQGWLADENHHEYDRQGLVGNINNSLQRTPEVNLRDEEKEIAIDNAETIEQLASLKKDLPSNLMPAYMKKLKELTK